MSKKEFTLDVTPELLADVSHVLDMAAKNKYSTAKIYAAYNAVTGKKDQPQNCVTCLRNRVKALKIWHDAYVGKQMKPAPVFPSGGDTAPPSDEERPDGRIDPQDDETSTVGFPEPPIDVIALHVPALEKPVYFKPGKDAHKGTVVYQGGGGAIKPGKYVTSDDRELAVQPGGKATLKAAPDNDLL